MRYSACRYLTHAHVQNRWQQTNNSTFQKHNNPEQSLIEICSQHLSYSLKLAVKKCIIEYYILKFINYSCSSYPTRASYSGQVDGFRNPMKNELKTRPCLKPVFETISNTDANFLNLQQKHVAINNFIYETNFKPKLFTAKVECNGIVLKEPKTEKAILFKFSLNDGELVFWFTFNLAVHFRPKMALTLEILSH